MKAIREWFGMRMEMALEPSPQLTPKSKRLLELATRCFGDGEKALDWLRAPSAVLGGRSPFEFAKEDEEGYRAVVDELGRIKQNDWERWDKEIESNSNASRFNFLTREARVEKARGSLKDL